MNFGYGPLAVFSSRLERANYPNQEHAKGSIDCSIPSLESKTGKLVTMFT